MVDEVITNIYPSWCKDELDKLIVQAFNRRLASGKNPEITYSMLSKEVLEILITKVSQGTTLNDRLRKLIADGILASKPKETRIEVFFQKQQND